MVEYVIAHCTVTPVRQEPSEGSEQLTQLLFGEVCEVLDRLPRWTKIRSTLDTQEGWVDFKMVSLAPSLIASSPRGRRRHSYGSSYPYGWRCRPITHPWHPSA